MGGWSSLQKRLATTGCNNLVKIVCFVPFFLAIALAGWAIYIWTLERNTADVGACKATTIVGLLMADGIIMLVCIVVTFIALVVNVICFVFYFFCFVEKTFLNVLSVDTIRIIIFIKKLRRNGIIDFCVSVCSAFAGLVWVAHLAIIIAVGCLLYINKSCETDMPNFYPQVQLYFIITMCCTVLSICFVLLQNIALCCCIPIVICLIRMDSKKRKQRKKAKKERREREAVELEEGKKRSKSKAIVPSN